ncbi:hypothetical protein ACFL01_02735, partial [Planctomycetota bacterium]
TATITGTLLEVTEGLISWSLLNYNLYYTSSSQTDSYTYRSSGGLESDDIGGTVTYSTSIAFTGARHEYANTGSMLVLGVDGSRMTVSAVDNAWTAVAVDENGDGTTEYENQLTWTELLAGG